jgi:hypothetical protein
VTAEVRGPIMDRRYWHDTPGETFRECLSRWDAEYNANAGPKRPDERAR